MRAFVTRSYRAYKSTTVTHKFSRIKRCALLFVHKMFAIIFVIASILQVITANGQLHCYQELWNVLHENISCWHVYYIIFIWILKCLFAQGMNGQRIYFCPSCNSLYFFIRLQLARVFLSMQIRFRASSTYLRCPSRSKRKNWLLLDPWLSIGNSKSWNSFSNWV